MSEQAKNLQKRMNQTNQVSGSLWKPQIKNSGRPCITVAVSSGKGGVGKTNFSLNFALLLKKLHYRVLLIDADLGLANIDIMLGISPQKTLADYLFRDQSIESVIYTARENLEILPAKNGLQAMAQLNEEQIQKLGNAFVTLEKTYDFILFDTSAGIQIQTTSFILSSKEVILILTPEPTSFVDVYSMIKIISQNQPGKKIHIVVNMARDSKEAEEQFEKLSLMSKKFLKKKLSFLGYLPYDTNVLQAVRNQIPIAFNNDQTHFCKELKKIRDNWLKQENYVHQYSLSEKFKKILTIGLSS